MIHSLCVASTLLTFLFCLSVNAQTTAFTYQGSLTDGGNPANGSFQMQFKLFDAVSGGTQIGSTVSDVAVTAANGVFKARLDFGASAFTGANRWLEIAVRHNAGEAYVTLSPREQIASSPYAVRTLTAAAADSLAPSCIGCVTSSQIASVNGSTVTGTIPVASVPTGSTNYIQNSSSPQTASSFNISGNGIIGGKVGIGTSTPSTKLEVVDPVRQLRFGPTAADNGGYLISTAPHQAMMIGGGKWEAPNWIARDAVASMTAHQFGGIEFYTNSNLTVGTTFSPNLRMAIQPNGNVGIGTATAAPGYKVDINTNGGGIRGFFNGSTHFVSETTGGTNSWARYYMRSPSQSWLIGTSENYIGNAFYLMDETNGVQTRMAIYPNGPVYLAGNTTQDRASYGLPKAMVEVYRDGSIVRCYNAISGSSAGTCGFSAVYLQGSDGSNKRYEVNFGFDVRDRFFSATLRYDNVSSSGVLSVELKPFSSFPFGEIIVRSFESTTHSRSSFYLIVY